MREVRVPVGEARKNMRAIVHRAAKGARVKITRYNRTLAVIISRDDLNQLEECEQPSRARRRAPRSRAR